MVLGEGVASSHSTFTVRATLLKRASSSSSKKRDGEKINVPFGYAPRLCSGLHSLRQAPFDKLRIFDRVYVRTSNFQLKRKH